MTGGMTSAVVPLMAATFFAVVGSQVTKLEGQFGEIITAVPIYAAFLVIMAFLGLAAARAARLDTRRARALIFTGATRNSLVVLPLALALPDDYAITPTIVVTQMNSNEMKPPPRKRIRAGNTSRSKKSVLSTRCW